MMPHESLTLSEGKIIVTTMDGYCGSIQQK